MRILKIPVNIIFALILMLSAGWIWLSRDSDNSSSAGEIPAPHKGFLAPDFNLTTLDGESIKLSDLRGQSVLVNVWATWCLPCRTEMPAMQRLYEDYSPQGFRVLAINNTVQDSISDVKDFVTENQLTFPILLDPDGEATRLYQVRALPTSFFIDADGIIQEVVIGGPMAEALLRSRADKLIEAKP